ncbi:Putative periplasmic protein [hydrothermal vent metagenome]|uniref:Putative periplasmic protein n=1 Tax=hydrothermal vent metagenome TaxID=652676 RepID=A0A1W1EH50_9ZZZZ
MEQILPSYRDPLFSILLIITLILFTALITYIWGIYAQNRSKEHLEGFLDKFDNTSSIDEDWIFNPNMVKSLEILAKVYQDRGEYNRSIDIYLYLIKNSDTKIVKIKFLNSLGEVYLRAGFLQRANNIFLEILRDSPRTPDTLYNLLIIYEMLHQYDKALEVITPLRILNQDIDRVEEFLKFQTLIYDKNINDKSTKLKEMLNLYPSLYRNIISYLFRHNDINIAWSLFQDDRLLEILDILWILPKSKVDLDIISKYISLERLYYAKGYLEESKNQSNIFVIEILANSKSVGLNSGGLSFTYICNKCQNRFPISFYRCPNCMAINSINVEVNIIKI